MQRLFFVALLSGSLLIGSFGSCADGPTASAVRERKDWREALAAQLGRFGHRNWILVVDKAYPLQASPGITYLEAQEGIAPVLTQVLTQIQLSAHINAIAYRDAELAHIDETLVPGIGEFKREIGLALETLPVNELTHEAIFEKMDEASKLFGILVIKTNETIPYSSVFIELDCAYWDAERESRLRNRINDSR